MGFMDKLGSAANTAKWKADQQMRLMRVQNNVHDLEKQVNGQKATLADAVLELYAQGALADERLTGICAAIGQLDTQIAGLNENLHQIQAEQPPSENQPAAAVPAPAPYTPPAPAPVQAAEAVVPLTPVAAAPAAPTAPVELVCPECGQVLKGKFCPEHGVAGVPRQA
jgi:hypothetical protein